MAGPQVRYAVFTGIVGVGAAYYYVNKKRDTRKGYKDDVQGAIDSLSSSVQPRAKKISWEERKQRHSDATVAALSTEPVSQVPLQVTNDRPIAAFIGHNWNKFIDGTATRVIGVVDAVPRKLRDVGLLESDEPV